MADEKPDLKTIEMRLAAIEDKLAKMHVTEEEMRAYEKVSALIGGQGGVAEAVSATPVLPGPIPRSRFINRSILPPRQIVRFCFECNECGPCACGWGGGFSGGGGFGGFGG